MDLVAKENRAPTFVGPALLFIFVVAAGLRAQFLKVIDEYLESFPEPRPAISGHEFYFCKSVSYVFPSGINSFTTEYVSCSSI